MGLDATRKLPGEGYHRGWPELVRMNEETRQLVDQLRNTGFQPASRTDSSCGEPVR